ncbi:MAG: trigger factor [Kiritimatiellae bacterium]|nr:trigger factor [Kiritimatiellia bacterium]
MKTSSKRQDKCKVEISVELSAEETLPVIKEVEKAFMRDARLPGFRPGKAPIELVRKNFAAELKEEQARATIRKFYQEATKAEKVEPINLREVTSVKCDRDGGELKFVVEIKPEFKLPQYKGLKIKAADASVSDKEVAERIEAMRVQYAKYEDAKEGDTVGTGDFAQVDYTGTVDGKPIAEIAPDAKVVASGTGYWMRVEEGYFLPELVEAVKGMKAGETKENIKAKFDKETAPDALKGKKAAYTLKLTTFRKRVLPDDAALVAATKDADIDALTARVRKDLERLAVEREERRRENEAVELLMKKVDFEVPESQVEMQVQHYLSDLMERAKYMGLTNEYFEKNREQILKDASANAERQVRLWHVIDAIVAEEKIEAKDEEKGRKVLELILANAK